MNKSAFAYTVFCSVVSVGNWCFLSLFAALAFATKFYLQRKCLFCCAMLGFRIRFINKAEWLLIAAYIIAISTIFFLHSRSIIIRYLKHEILETRKNLYNDSLPMPIVEFGVESRRRINSSRAFVEMNFSAFFNEQPLPDWAFVLTHTREETLWQDLIDLNTINSSNYDYVKGNELWPVRAYYATGDRESGFLIEGIFNGTSYIELQSDGQVDYIKAKIYSFAIDPGISTYTEGVPDYFELMCLFSSSRL